MKEFQVGGIPISEYLNPKHRGQRVTRGEIAQLIQLFATKAAISDALESLEFNVRQQIKAEVEKALAEAGGERRTESGIVLAK